MKSLIETDEVAKDVAGAEMLIERHQEHKVMIGGILEVARQERSVSAQYKCSHRVMF
jgi:hypothetical protein